MVDPNVWVSGLINPYWTPARVIAAAALTEAAAAEIVTGDADLLEANLSPAAITPWELVNRPGWT